MLGSNFANFINHCHRVTVSQSVVGSPSIVKENAHMSNKRHITLDSRRMDLLSTLHCGQLARGSNPVMKV